MDAPPQAHVVAWHEWTSQAFARARDERKPILLSIVAPWSTGCREMDRVCYADRALAAAINRDVVAVRVDADQRPDIADRYDLGGLPATVFLTAGGEMLGGGTFVPPDRLLAALLRVVGAVATDLRGVRGPEVERQAGAASPPTSSEAGPAIRHAGDPLELTSLVFATFDAEHAGFGGAPRFPHTAPVHLALDLYAERDDAAMRDCAVRTLDAMGWGGLYDEHEGGFFRCAAALDWSGAPAEKLLSVNAALLNLYLHAWHVLGDERWIARAADLVRFINGDALSAANGAWRHATGAAPSRQFADGNAQTAGAMLRASAELADDEVGRRALAALERVLLACYRPGDGVAHSASGIRGLLVDQVAMAAASLDAWEATGNIVYRMMAEELMHYALRTMWDQESDGFFDRASGIGAVEPWAAQPLKPFIVNCEAAVVLHRLAQATDEPAFAGRAARTLEAVASCAGDFGPLAAHYVIARRAVFR